ncbi:hypothetical protein PG984_011991 [Apiospora sp. TS-2023a]
MVYTDRMTSAMSPLANQYYDTVKARVLAKRPNHAERIEKTLKRMMIPVLMGCFKKGMHPGLSADVFRWNVARAAWKHYFHDEPFPCEDKKPERYDTPCCEQYVRYWYLHTKMAPSISGERTTICSSTETTPIHAREAFAQKVHNSLKLVEDGEPLAFPIPKVRQLQLCVGDKENMKKTLIEAASVLGPEFTLSCLFGGNERAVLILGLAPGVDGDNENVILRARNPIDWLQDWWVRLLETDTNLLEHLQRLARQRFTRPEDRIRIPKHAINVLETNIIFHMSQDELEKAFDAQQRELDRLALEIAREAINYDVTREERAAALVAFVENGHHQVHILNRDDRLRVVQSLVQETAVYAVRRMILDKTNFLPVVTQQLDGYIGSGSVEAPFVEDERSRLKIARDVWSSMTTEVDGLLSHWEGRLQRDD